MTKPLRPELAALLDRAIGLMNGTVDNEDDDEDDDQQDDGRELNPPYFDNDIEAQLKGPRTYGTVNATALELAVESLLRAAAEALGVQRTIEPKLILFTTDEKIAPLEDDVESACGGIVKELMGKYGTHRDKALRFIRALLSKKPGLQAVLVASAGGTVEPAEMTPDTFKTKIRKARTVCMLVYTHTGLVVYVHEVEANTTDIMYNPQGNLTLPPADEE